MPLLSTRGGASAKGFGLTAGGKGLFAVNLTISTDTTDYDLYNAATAPGTGWAGVTDASVTVTINSGTIVSSSSPGTTAFNVGSGWPAGSLVTLNNNGVIVGRGGNGGNAGPGGPGSPGSPGDGGSTAFNTSRPITIVNNDRIAGGGGGGGGGAGGRNASRPQNNFAGGGGGGGIGTSSGGTGWVAGTPGTKTAAGGGGAAQVGQAGAGGAGGSYGSSGTAGSNSSGGWPSTGGNAGASGSAIIGYSYVTLSGTGQVNGPTSG